MKAFVHKLKKCNKILLSLYLISLITYTVFYNIFTYNILRLATIETPIRILIVVIFGFWLIVWLIAGLMALFTRKYKPYTILIVFTTIFTGIFGFGNYVLGSLLSNIDGMSKSKLVYTSNLIALKNTEFNSSSKIGMINDEEDIEGFKLGNKLIKDNTLSNEIERYDDYYIMLNDLYNNKIDACVVSGNYVVNFSSEEQFENIAKETKVIFKYSEEMDNQDNVSYTNKSLTEPFTILLMGVDSESDGLNANQAFNGDTLMLITFNPKTLTASVFSIPRDTYVPIACRNNQFNKINSSAASGTTCVINTIKNLTDINIDFYVKMNFKGVVDLVDAIGGVTVDVEEPYFKVNNGVNYGGKVCEQNSLRQFGDNMVCIDPGLQRLNGEQALAYSRNRHQYIGSDIDRVKHQQQVVSAITNEVKNITSFEQFQNILGAVERNMDTNMTSEQILSLYNVAKKIVLTSMNSTSDPVSINKTYLETYSLPVWIGYSYTSALGYYKDSLDEITKMMKVNLELENVEMPKTFSIDYNEDYKSRFYGEGKRGTPMEATMPNLIGKSKEDAASWCTKNSITPSYSYVSPGDEHYNSLVGAGMVADQSVHIGTLVNNVKEVTLYINNQSAQSTTPSYTPSTDESEDKKDENATTPTQTPSTVSEEQELPETQSNNKEKEEKEEN